MPKISIIVPVYKVEKYLNRCLDSIIAQTFTDWECILIDDGSPDNSGKICDEYADKDNRFIIKHQTNAGVSVARNVGLDSVQGEYICFVDSDDWVEQTWLEDLYECAIKNNVDMVVCGVNEHRNSNSTSRVFDLPKKKEDLMLYFIKHPNYMNYLVNKIIKKTLFDKNIRFPVGISICEDLWVSFRLCFYANAVFSVNKALYNYDRSNENSATNNYKRKYFDDKLYITERIIDFLSQNNCIHKKYSQIVSFYKIYTKLPLLLYPSLRDSDLWNKTFPESNKYIWKIPLRLDYKIISWLASKKLFNLAYFMQDIKKR